MSNVYDRYTVERETFERRKVIGPMSRGQEIMRAMHDDGWRMTFSGPYTDKWMHPKVDPTRFLFVAERVVVMKPTWYNFPNMNQDHRNWTVSSAMACLKSHMESDSVFMPAHLRDHFNRIKNDGLKLAFIRDELREGWITALAKSSILKEIDHALSVLYAP